MHKLPATEPWPYFLSLCNVPRPSHKEQQAIQFVKTFAEVHHLACKVDDAGNVLISKPASAGMEDRPGIILQAHLDMVPQKNPDIRHDFEKDAIKPRITDDGLWMKAEGTTLGADDGIGIAAALSVLADDTLTHGPLEALFTVEEETGLTGALALQPGWMQGKILLNLDNEEDGEFCIGCAGGLDLAATFRLRREPVPEGYALFDLSLSGLKGGHSGSDIHLGRANALKMMCRFLWMAAAAFDIRMIGWSGGEVHNAIPRHTQARVAVAPEAAKELKEFTAQCNRMFSQEYRGTEDNITLTCRASKPTAADSVWNQTSQKKILSALYAMPDGVLRMSSDVPGLVETSTNWGVLLCGEKTLSAQCLLRSAKESAKAHLANMMRAAIELGGGRAVFSGAYPGWAPQPDTEAVRLLVSAYERLFGTKPVVKAIHAGLECGIIGGKYPGLQMISFGPTIRHPHSPDEAIELSTVDKFWQLLLEAIKSV
ncbi:MAG: aminoacyl-histidine dipeptidase [Bacteroidales bacterium]|nr:aminoacyl-histidine dipeptidase [Bacteroidales bacterium]